MAKDKLKSKKIRISLTAQIFIGLFAGVALGWLKPDWGVQTSFLRNIFLNLIKSIIAPLMFSTIVVGIAGGGDLKKVGRIGLKALVYFEIITTIALFAGLLVVNITKPGVGVVLQSGSGSGDLGQLSQTHPMTFIETIVHIFPTSIIDAMARGDVLQIVAFSVLFGIATSALGQKKEIIVKFCEGLSQVMFKFTGYVMKFAPFGVGAAMAATVGHKGLGVLLNLGMLVGSLYIALAIFIIFAFGSVIIIFRLPLKKFIQAVREPFTLAFATTSSEAALPKALEVMERLGVPRRIVGFVIPTGYSFNLDGSTLYLAVASVFVAQAAETTMGIHFGLDKQIMLMLTLMITSKGVAGVPRAALVILLAALHTFGLPPEGVAVIFAVDELMDMGRTSVNVLGNCLASCVVARWEGEFDDNKARLFGTPEESLNSDLQEESGSYAKTGSISA
ncbi:MAG: cation:dicarboxylase symporter family transporter [Bacteroidota bacterium]|nr:cation:dicarboxylase symporter family transporter [Bacteroidota bacterium]MDP4190268.1 cation:dicarboxylase symporter family transporter [Bacteroidota bacterium]MDP4194269.1 cation:dicarboxylase symporter family transporter [Bacteroidota bacterium]